MEAADIRHIAVAALLDGQQGERIAGIEDDLPLGDAGLAINSLSLMRAFIILEDRLGITIDDAALAGARFATVGDFIAFIDRAAGARAEISKS